MTVEQIKDLLEATPFRPFRIAVSNGRNFDVEHPGDLCFLPDGQTLLFANSANSGVARRIPATQILATTFLEKEV